MASPDIHPIILSGGAGTRLWPMSRQLRPKQFFGIYGDASMFAQTISRVAGDSYAPPVVVCNHQHRFLVAEELRNASVKARDIILEPAARNTAPAIAVAALRLSEIDSDAVMLVLPSDHMIADTNEFDACVRAAVTLARDGHVVTFGLPPRRPETGFGYILRGTPLGDDGWTVERFVEKPNQDVANEYVADARYLWNAGMFVFTARTFLQELEKFQPEIGVAAARALAEGAADLDFLRLGTAAFEAAPSISVDYAVIEKTERAAVVLLRSRWSDLGSWSGLWEEGEQDADGNVVRGRVVALDARQNLIHTEKPMIAALGIEDLVIVATDDVVLVLPKDRAQDLKSLVAAVEAVDREKVVSHSRVYRPWGHYQNLDEGDAHLVKQIVVEPGAKLSLQRHNHRAEHWIVVEGTAVVTKGDEVFEMTANQSTYIPVGTDHRLENRSEAPLRLIEVQTGGYLSEDDIVRLDDTYGRE